MIIADEYCYTASVLLQATAERAMDYLKKSETVGDWAFGAWNPVKPLDDGLYQANSLFNGAEVVYRINVYEKFHQIDYEVGYTADDVQPWLMVRVIPGAVVGRDPETSLLSIIAWRSEAMGDQDWKLVAASHEAEVFRVKHMIESQT